MSNDKEYWDYIYETKKPEEFSWTENIPIMSIQFIQSLELTKNTRIIDVGGGDSKLVDFLLDQNYEDITIFNISGNALDRAKHRLGRKADKVKWIEGDITEYQPESKFDLWHDRATFHFLTSAEQISSYITIIGKSVKPNGHSIIGTFSKSGPNNCSGLPVVAAPFLRLGCQRQFTNITTTIMAVNCGKLLLGFVGGGFSTVHSL